MFDHSVKSIAVIHDVDNTSDHDPLFLELELTVARCKFNSPKFVPKPSWNKTTPEHIDEYKRVLYANLCEIALAIYRVGQKKWTIFEST